LAEEIEDEPLTLAEACQLIFRGTISPATLRAEAERGRLVIERIGRRDFVTRRAIREMRKKCEMAPEQKAPGSGFSPSASARTESPMSPPSGSSAMTTDTSVALASVLMIAEQLSGNSPATSPRTTRRKSAKVIPLKH
jgi:hypothetical protein